MNPTKFAPKPGKLLSIEKLEAMAEVTAEDVDAAVKVWRARPPDRKFARLLEAKGDDG
jgi:hypothetical protein